MIPGFDCYSGYGQIDFNLARAAGYRFVWVKCQEGNEGKDPLYERNVQRAKAAGLAVGPYHFAFPLPNHPDHKNRGPLEQAELFFKACNGLGSKPGDLSPAIDLEWPPPEEWAKWGCSASQISEWSHECCEAMALLWQRLPAIYTYPNWWRELSRGADTSWASRYPLWLASYTWTTDGPPPDGWQPPHLSCVSESWSEWVACQHSADGSRARIPGVPACPVDRDVIRDEETFLRLTGRPAWDPDADTQPVLVPSIPPRPLVDFPIVHPPVPLGTHGLPMIDNDDGDDEPPQAA